MLAAGAAGAEASDNPTECLENGLPPGRSSTRAATRASRVGIGVEKQEQSLVMAVLALVVPALVLVVGWFVGDRLSQDRTLRHQQTNLQTEILLQAYQSIERAAQRDMPLSESCAAAVEDAIASL